MALDIETVRTAVRLAGVVPEEVLEPVVDRLYTAVKTASLEGALQRHLRDVSEARGERWLATIDSVERALNALDPEPRNRRTAGVILEGNLFAQAQRDGVRSIWPHTVRLGAELVQGFIRPSEVDALETTDLIKALSPKLSADRLRFVYGGAPMGTGLPQRNYVGAGYDPDGNVDLVFLAFAFGPRLAEGHDHLSTWQLRDRIDAWIRLRFEEARAGRGPRVLVELVAEMAEQGRADSLLEDSRVIAGSAWLEVLTDDHDFQHTLEDVVAFLDGRRFHGIH